MAKDGKSIETIDASLNPDGDVKSTKVKVNWLPAYDELVELELHDFGYLITKKQPEGGRFQRPREPRLRQSDQVPWRL